MKKMLAVLIGAIMLTSRPMVVEAVDQSTPVDAAVKEDFKTKDEHVPIYCTWSGDWIDQHGHTIEGNKGKSYLKQHSAYAAKVYNLNTELFWTPNSYRSFELEEIQKQADFASCDKFDYQFVDEVVQKLTDKGIVIMKVLPDFELSTVRAYLDWSGKKAKSIPLFETKNGWLDQFSESMNQEMAEDFFKKHKTYREALEQLNSTAQLVELSQDEIRSELEQAYSMWFIERMCRKHDIVDETDLETPQPHEPRTPGYKANKRVSKRVNTLTDYVIRCERNLYNQYAAEIMQEAVESMRGSKVWCDDCYALYRVNLSTPDHRWVDGTIYCNSGAIAKYVDNNAAEEPEHPGIKRGINQLEEGQILCLKGHVCGRYTSYSTQPCGPFNEAANQQCEKILKEVLEK